MWPREAPLLPLACAASEVGATLPRVRWFRNAFILLLAPISFAVIAGCGGAVDGGPTLTSGNGSPPGGGGQASLSPDGGGGTGGINPSGTDAGSGDTPFHDPGCPPQMKVDGVHQCDVDSPAAGCGPGNSCVPYVRYGKDCHAEEIGTLCTPAGTAAQGDDCAGTTACAVGYVCVSAGNGFQCAQLCHPKGSQSDCPAGLLCEPLDVPGNFVCG